MSSFNSIQQIKDYVDRHGGLQLTNRFNVSFFNVPSYTGVIEIQAQQVDMAPINLNFTQDNLNGFGFGRFVPRSQQLMAGGNGVLVTFPVTNDNYILNFFNNWFNYFFSSAKNIPSDARQPFVLPFYDQSIKNVSMVINILDPNGNVNSRITYFEVFPVETQPLMMTMLKNDSYMTYSVLFGFRDYIHTFFNTP
jgi:hypothetical protein